MRKRIIPTEQQDAVEPDLDWLNIDELAEVEITSEDAEHPVEAALLPGQASGWRAAQPGEQTIRLLFSNPQPLRRIWLHFAEPGDARTQEYVVRWAPKAGAALQEIVRQQWNFSPDGSTSEMEDLHVDLPAVAVLELSIIPNISGGGSIASLEQLRLA